MNTRQPKARSGNRIDSMLMKFYIMIYKGSSNRVLNFWINYFVR